MFRDDRGQALVEYALIIALVSIFALGALTSVGESINEMFTELTAVFS